MVSERYYQYNIRESNGVNKDKKGLVPEEREVDGGCTTPMDGKTKSDGEKSNDYEKNPPKKM